MKVSGLFPNNNKMYAIEVPLAPLSQFKRWKKRSHETLIVQRHEAADAHNTGNTPTTSRQVVDGTLTANADGADNRSGWCSEGASQKSKHIFSVTAPLRKRTTLKLLSILLCNTVLQYSLKDEIQRWQKKKGMGIYLSDHDRDCLTNLRFADDVMLFATSKEQMWKMMCEFKKATEKVGLKIHQDKTKILSNQSTINSDTQKHIEVGDMSIEILTRNESVKYLGQRISFYQQETIEIKSRIRAAWATFHKYRQELTSKNYMLKHRLFDATVSPTICYAAGTWAPNKDHERMIQSTQRKMLRLIVQTKRICEKIEKQDTEPKEENGKVDITDMCSTDDESGDGQSTKTQDDVDSEVTFEEDPDEEMDTTAIEEEDWIDYIKRNTVEALDKMGHAKISMLEQDTQKMKWKLALRIATSPSERWLKKAAEWSPDLSSRYKADRAIGRPRKRWEDDINDFLKQVLAEKKNENPQSREAIKPTRIGSTLSKTGEDGLHSKKITQ